MPLPKLIHKQVDVILSEFCRTQVPFALRDEIRLSYQFRGNSVTLIEQRPVPESPDKCRNFQRLLDLKVRRKSSQLPVPFPDPKTNSSPASENCKKYRLSEDGIWNIGSNLDDLHQGAETHLAHGSR